MTKGEGQDYEQIPLTLTSLDKITVWYMVICTILVCVAMIWLTTFDGVWVWGMPRSAFGTLLIGGILNAVIVCIFYFAYKSHYKDALEKGTENIEKGE